MNDKKRIFGFNKNVFNLGLVSFFTDMSSEMIYPIIPVFLSSVLGVNKSVIGLIEGIAEGSGSVLRVFSGWISDKLKKRKEIVIVGYILSTITKPFLAISNSGLAVLFIRIFDRTGKALRNPPRDAMLAGYIEKTERGRAFGLQRAMDDAGAVAGPLFCFGLLYALNSNYRMIFLLSFIPAAVACLVLIFLVKEKHNGLTPLSEKIVKDHLGREFFLFTVVTVVFNLGNSSNAFLFLKAESCGVPVLLLPVTWMVYNGVSSIFAIPSGIVSDRLGRRNVLIIGILVYALVYAGFAFSKNTVSVWILMAVYGIYFGITEGVGRAYVADLVKDKTKLATAYGIYHMAVGVSLFFASFLFGLIWQYLGAKIAFLTGAAFAFTAGIMLLCFLKNSREMI